MDSSTVFGLASIWLFASVIAGITTDDPLTCQDDFSERTCAVVVESGACQDKPNHVLTLACRMSCGLCPTVKRSEARTEDVMQGMERAQGPTCQDNPYFNCEQFSGIAAQPICCGTFKQVFNTTCPKSCKFCTQTSLIPGNPMPQVPIPGTSGGGPSIVTQQDPCGTTPDAGKPPTASLNPGR